MITRFHTLLGTLTVILLLVRSSVATVSILSTNVLNPGNADGSLLANGTLGLIVIDTGNNGFGVLKAGSVALNAFIGDGDDYVAGRLASVTVFGTVTMQLGGAVFSVVAPSPIRSGNAFQLIWLPGLTLADESVVGGQTYGQARELDWVIPTDGNDIVGDLVSAAGAAGMTISGMADDAYTSWVEAHFSSAERSDAAISSPHADPDGDLYPNLLEFVLAGHPKDAGDIGNVEAALHEQGGQTYLAFIVPRNSLEQIALEGQASTNLTQWQSVSSPSAFDSARDVIRDTVPLSDPNVQRRFFRMRAFMTSP